MVVHGAEMHQGGRRRFHHAVRLDAPGAHGAQRGVGGASGPEVAALEAFRADPALLAVRAWCVEEFGPYQDPPPSQAVVCFRGVDDQVGPITSYTLVEPYVPLR